MKKSKEATARGVNLIGYFVRPSN